MRKLNIYHIDQIVGDAGFGGSCPIIVKANDKEYILKTKEDGMQPNSLGIFNELLAYQILSILKYEICPQQVNYLYVDENFTEMARVAFSEGKIKEESFENIRESSGINLGIEYLHNTMEPLDGVILNDSFIKDLAHIDNYILNCDRSKDNINVLQDKKNTKKYYAIDFGNALGDGIDGVLYNKIINEDTDIFSNGVFSNCNATLSGRYALKPDVKRLIKKARLIKDDFSTIRNNLSLVIDNFPSEWEPVKYKDVIIDILATRIKNRYIFNITDKCPCLY